MALTRVYSYILNNRYRGYGVMKKNKKGEQNWKLTTPLVSIIIATFRRDKSLKRALHSLMNQTYSFIEIIVVDDNAEANWNRKVDVIVRQVMSQYNTKILYIKNKQNKGSAETRNIGVTSSTGNYITFLDDDDVYLPNKVKNQLEYMINYELDYTITDLNLFDERDRLIQKRNRNYIKDTSKSKLIKYHLLYHMTGTDVMMFKKDYFLRIGGFPSINVGDEFYLMLRAIEGCGKFGYLPVCDVKAYVHTKTNGLSSGESKINGEIFLHNNKKKYFDILSSADKRYITMRHFAVLAYTEVRRRNYPKTLLYVVKSFCSSPINFLNLFINRK